MFRFKSCILRRVRFSIFRFLPPLTRHSLDTMLFKSGIEPLADTYSSEKTCSVNNGVVTIGDTAVPQYKTLDSVKVPNVLFYDLPQVIFSFAV